MAITADACAAEVYPFYGQVDFINKSFALSVERNNGRADLKIDPAAHNSYHMQLDVERMHTPFFEMTTHIQGVVKIEQNDVQPRISGYIQSESTQINGTDSDEISGHFELASGVLRVQELNCGGFAASGSLAVDPPHELNTRIGFEDVDVSYFVEWLVGPQKNVEASGLMSGQIALSGTPEKLLIKAQVVSQHGNIEKVAYDLLSLHLQGVYPDVGLTDSTVTQKNGFSFDLDGTVDLSDKEHMAAQLKAIKKIPLIKDTASQSEWVLKRVQDSEGEGKTETKFFLKKDKKTGLSGREDSSLFGVEKKIGF